MKYLVLIFIVLAGVWWIRQQRRTHQESNQATNKQAPSQLMVPCAHCGVHVPQNDATRGAMGVYCNPEHKVAHEG